MNRSAIRLAALVGLASMALGLAACGVRPQSEAQVLPPNALPSPLRIPTPAPATPTAAPPSQPSASPAPSASRLRLWLVQDDGLAAVESDLLVGTSPDVIVQSLALDPTPAEAAAGLRTVARDPLTGLPLVAVAPSSASPSATPPTDPGAATGPPSAATTPTPGSVTVTISSAFSALPPAEQVLLLGQVVLSLTGAGEESVAFADEAGSRVAVPLPDGRLLDEPATARDYASLIVRP